MAAALDILLQDWRERLRAWSVDGSLASAARHALELDDDPPLLTELVRQWAEGDFSALPPIVLLPASSMPGAAGAYAISTGTIYLNEDWLETASDERVIAVLTEELGHHLDGALYEVDTPGDEGRLFSNLLLSGNQQHAITIVEAYARDCQHVDDRIIVGTDKKLIAEASSIAWPVQGGGEMDDHINSVVAMSDGTLLTTGVFFDKAIFGETEITAEGYWDAFVSKVKSDGSFAWTTRLGGGGIDQAADIAILSDGSAIITGDFQGRASFGESSLISRGGSDVFVAKVDPSGDVEWVFQAGGAENDSGKGITALSDGSTIITGYFSGAATFGEQRITSLGYADIFVAKINPDGSFAWATRAGGESLDIGNKIEALPDGASIVVGSFEGSASFGEKEISTENGPFDVFIAKLDPDGDFAWVTRGGGNAFDYGNDIAVAKDGSILITGSFSGNASFGLSGLTSLGQSDVFISKLNPNGSFAWTTQAGGNSEDHGEGITLLEDGSALITGTFKGNASFGEIHVEAGGLVHSDIFAAKISSQGKISWVATAGGESGDISSDIVAIHNGPIMAVGSFIDKAQFGEGELMASGGSDFFVARLNQDGKWLSSDKTPPAISSPPTIIESSDSGRSNSDNITSVNNPTLTGIAEPGSVINLLLDGVLYPANTAVTTADPVTGEWSYTHPPEHAATEDVTYSLSVTATDQAGNTSDPSDPIQVTIDVTKPVFSSGCVAKAIDENSGAGQVVYTVNVTDFTDVTFELKAGTADFSAFSIDSLTGEVTLTADPDYETQSSYGFTVVATDAAGNSAEQAVSLAINDLDDTAPEVPSTPDLIAASDSGSSEADNLTNDTTPTFSGTAEAGSTVELFADGQSLGTTFADEEGNWQFTVPDQSVLSDGSYAITATATSIPSRVVERTAIPQASPGRTKQEVRNTGAFAALKDDGSVITWGLSAWGGDSSSVSPYLKSGVSQIFSTGSAFAALKENGSVVTWGLSNSGGDSSRFTTELQSGVAKIFSTDGAFAALKQDNSVVTWGNPEWGGQANGGASSLQETVVDISSTYGAFAAITDKGRVVSWGNKDWGADSSSVASKLASGVKYLQSTGSAFAALRDDGSVITWGNPNAGGDSTGAEHSLKSGIKQIYSNRQAFAAINEDGIIVTWGAIDNSQTAKAAVIDPGGPILDIVGNSSAFAALRGNGSVFAWGLSSYGGDTSRVDTELGANVSKIFANNRAFVALKDDGTAISWGDDSHGGWSEPIRDVVNVASTSSGFAALKSDGSVATWGGYGGNSSGVATKLESNVVQIYSSHYAFSALRKDGSVVTWGDEVFGGDSSNVGDQLNEGIVSLADPFHDDRLVVGDTMTSAPSPALAVSIDATHPTFTSAATPLAIDENSGARQVIYTAVATDDTTISYSLKAGNKDDAAAFSIDAASGEVTLAADPDYETKSAYSFTVVATDAAGNSSEQEVSLAINDIQEIPAVQLSISSQSIRSGSTIAIPINISDATGVESLDLTLSYDPAVFALPATGTLVTPGSLTPGAAFVVNDTPPGQVSISWTRSTPLTGGTGSIATLNLQVRSDATPGETSLIDLLSSSINEGRISSEALDGSISILPPSFQVQAVRAMPNGIALALPEAPDMDAFNLYDGPEDVAVDQPDLTLTGPGGESVALSAHWQASSNELLLLTAAPLAAGDYTLAIDSRTDGLISASSGELLDGDGDGLGGDVYSYTFTHTAPETSLAIADTARGPGQALGINGTGTHDPLTGQPLNPGLPVLLSTSSSLTALAGSLTYDQQLLLNGALLAGSDLPDDWTFTIDPNSAAGKLLYSATGTTAITGTELEILRFQADVAAAGSELYGSSTLIEATARATNSTAEVVDVETDPGLIALAYSGDTTGNGKLSSLDASRVQRVVVELDSGFEAYDDLNPVLIGDTTGNGSLSSLDASRIQQEVVGLEVSSFPALPVSA